jgi:hypothetical protein
MHACTHTHNRTTTTATMMTTPATSTMQATPYFGPHPCRHPQGFIHGVTPMLHIKLTGRADLLASMVAQVGRAGMSCRGSSTLNQANAHYSLTPAAAAAMSSRPRPSGFA